MRFRFLWQLIAGFLLVMLVTLALSASRISYYMNQQIHSEVETRLLNYGSNIVSNNFSREDIKKVDQLLASDNISIQVYLANGSIIYPTYRQEYRANLTDSELRAIRQGQNLPLRVTYRPDQGKITRLATVYLPLNRQASDSAQFPAGFISLSEPIENLETRQQEVYNNIIFSFGIATVIGLGISVAYALFQTRKIRRLQQATRQITAGNYDVQLDISNKSRDEFGDLAHDFQVMTDSLAKSREEIKRQETLRRQFMMDAAHEMRTPLTTMSGVIEGLQYDIFPEPQRKRSLELLATETQRLIRLVNENLDYEKIRTNQISLNKQTLKAYDLLCQIRTQLTAKAQEKGNHLVIDAPEDLLIYGDRDRLVQIIINLVTNAIQFSENSDITLWGRQDGGFTELRIMDQGIGIDAKQIEDIWERFYKVDVSRKNTKFGESGIGLAVVKSLVEAHGGTIQVESELGQGSTFIIRLPLEASESGDQAQAQEATPNKSKKNLGTFLIGNKKAKSEDK